MSERDDEPKSDSPETTESSPRTGGAERSERSRGGAPSRIDSERGGGCLDPPRQNGRPDAALAIWCTYDPGDADAARTKRTSAIRRSALLRGLVGLAFAALLFAFDRVSFAIAVAAISTAITSLAWLSPHGAHARLQRAFVALGRVVGTTLSWLLLTPVYALFIVPMGALLRRGKRDTLERQLDPQRKSYWRQRVEDDPRLDRPY